MTDDDLSPARFGTAFEGFMEAVLRQASTGTALVDRIRAHLGVEPGPLPVVVEQLDPFEHPNLQVALDERLAAGGRRAELVGIGSEHRNFMALGLSDLVGSGGRSRFGEGPVDFVNFSLAHGRVLPCVQVGLYLVADGEARLVVLVAGPSAHGGPREKLRVEVMAARAEDGPLFLAELRSAMAELNVYRGHVISLSPDEFGMGPQTLVVFHELPTVDRNDVVLPAGLLERIERQTVVFAEHADQLRAAGRSLKRGLLLYGVPGTGKTLTIMHLAGRMPGRTVLLTTGSGMGLLRPVVQMARSLAPAMVVLEDVDLIAEERHYPRGGGPLLFELLNEMDGLREDSDVIFVLTTNRPRDLEPALAARPGRIDLAVELPLPDAAGRRRLLELYGRGLTLRDVDLDAVAAETEGASPAYVKELLRRAALLAAAEGGELVVTGSHVARAIGELAEGGRLARRLLGHRGDGDEGDDEEGAPERPSPALRTGYPSGATWSVGVGEMSRRFTVTEESEP